MRIKVRRRLYKGVKSANGASPVTRSHKAETWFQSFRMSGRRRLRYWVCSSLFVPFELVLELGISEQLLKNLEMFLIGRVSLRTELYQASTLINCSYWVDT